MKKREIVKELQKLQNYPVPHHRGFFVSLKYKLDEYMDYNPIREDPVYAGRVNLFLHRFKYMVPALIALLIIFSGGGVALAARGTLPGDILYPMKILSEDLRSTFTLRPEAQAKLQIRFTLERIEELEKILGEKGVDVKNLAVAQEGLQKNLEKATSIVSELSGENDINARSLAVELDQVIDISRESLKEAFESQKQELEKEEQELKAKQASIAQASLSTEELEKVQQIKSQKELLEKTAEDIESQMGEKKVELAKVVRQGMVEVGGIMLPAEVFEEFNSLITQAQIAFQAGDFQEAQRLIEKSGEVLAKTSLAKDLLSELGSIEEEINILEVSEELKIDLNAETPESQEETEVDDGDNLPEEKTAVEEETSPDAVQTAEGIVKSDTTSLEASVGETVEESDTENTE